MKKTGGTHTKTSSKTSSIREQRHAFTRRILQAAISEVKGAARPRVYSLKDGVSWLIALGAGAAVAWKSWQAAQEPLPEGHDNTTAKRFNAQLEREKRTGTPIVAITKDSPKRKKEKGSNEKEIQRAIQAALASARNNRSQSDQLEISRMRTNGSKVSGTPTGEPIQHKGGAAQGEQKIETGAMALAKEFYKRFNEDEVTTRAAALAFTGVFSLVPILLFAVIALGFVFRDPAEATKHVQGFVAQLLPGESASHAANEVLAQTHLVETAQGMTRHIGWPLLLGVGSLLWAGISLFVTASTPMNAAWDVTETRSFIQLRITALGVMLGAGLVFLLSLGVSALPHLVSSLDWPFFGTKGVVPFWADILFPLLAVALDAMMFILVYKFLPNTRVTWKAALFSGIITGLLWEIFKQGFAFYLSHFGDSNNKLYGALGGVVLLITWIYYSCIVLLAGAEVGRMYHEHKEEGGVNSRTPRASE